MCKGIQQNAQWLLAQALESDLGLQLSSGIYTLGKIGHVFFKPCPAALSSSVKWG